MSEEVEMPAPGNGVAAAMAAAWNAGQPQRVIDLAAGAAPAAKAEEPVLALLGLAQQQCGRHAEAAATFAKLCALRPEVSAYWNNRGVAARAAGDLATATVALEHARSLAPDDGEVAYNLGLVCIHRQRWAAARDVLLDAVRLAPESVAARLEAAHACHVCGDAEGEESLLADAGAWPPQPAAQALVLASILSVLGRLDVALRVLDTARLPEGSAAGAMRLRIAAQRVAMYERSNQLAAARRELQRVPLAALDALGEGAREAQIEGWRAHAAMALRGQRALDAAALYQRVLDVAVDPETISEAAFGLARARDRAGQYAAAWQALAIAHGAQRKIAEHAAPELAAGHGPPLPMAARMVAPDAYAAWRPLAGPAAAAGPVFVIGFPRSGTTLLEQMLDAHPDFCSMDERGYVYQLIERMERAGQRYPADLARLTEREAGQLRSVYWNLVRHVVPDLGRRRLVDKNPLNMLCLPMILRLFPAAPIILCVRHPCDVLLSCSMQAFRSPVFRAMCASLPRLARGYAEAFAQCCTHVELLKPRVLQWRYEDVVADPETALARLAGFLGVADPAPMADFAAHARAKRFIATPSYAQVTQPVHGGSVGRWRHYRAYLAPVLPVLQPWLDRFGYTT